MPRFFGALLALLCSLHLQASNSLESSCREGDLILRHGSGFWSDWFRDLSPREKRFSHVGIIIFKDDDPFVVHAIASEITGIGAVREEPLSSFIEGIDDWAIFRPNASTNEAKAIGLEARKLIGHPFDMQFDLSEHQRIYCTELAFVAVNQACQRTLIRADFQNGKACVFVDACYLSDDFNCIVEKTTDKP